MLAILSPFKLCYTLFCKKKLRKLLRRKSSEDLPQYVSHSDHCEDLINNAEKSWSNDWTLDDANSSKSKIEQYRQNLTRQLSSSSPDQG